MFSKFHWGHGIFIFYVLFVGVLATVLIASFNIDHTLVVDNYYAHDLAFQNKYDKISNEQAADKVSIIYDEFDKVVSIKFDKSVHVSGTIWFYRPSDKSLDFTKNLTCCSQSISTKSLIPGKWKLILDWQEENISYYKEHTIYI